MQFIRGPLRFFTRRIAPKRITIPVQHQPCPSPAPKIVVFNSRQTYADRLMHTTPIRMVVVKVPAFAESIIEGDIKFTVKVGDTVQAGDSVMEVETDKTTVPVPAPVTGKIVEIYVTDGDTVTPGQDLFKME